MAWTAPLLGHQIQSLVLAQRISSVTLNIRAAVVRWILNKMPRHEKGTLCFNLIKNSKSRFSLDSSFCLLEVSGNKLNNRANKENDAELNLVNIASSSRTDLYPVKKGSLYTGPAPLSQTDTVSGPHPSSTTALWQTRVETSPPMLQQRNRVHGEKLAPSSSVMVEACKDRKECNAITLRRNIQRSVLFLGCTHSDSHPSSGFIGFYVNIHSEKRQLWRFHLPTNNSMSGYIFI